MSALALDTRLAPALPRSAIALSVAFHVAALLLLPGLARKAEELPPLIATLRFLPPAAAVPNAPEPTPVGPARPQPAPTTPRLIHSAARAAPAPIVAGTEAPPSIEAIPVPAPAAPPEKLARADAAPAPAPTAPPAVAAAQESAALDDYGRALSDLLARQQQYPRLAALRGWEGEVRLRLKVARKGNLVAVQIVHSSGHEVLDQHALQMIQGATLPSPPDNFGDREIQVVVPIHYKLQKPT